MGLLKQGSGPDCSHGKSKRIIRYQIQFEERPLPLSRFGLFHFTGPAFQQFRCQCRLTCRFITCKCRLVHSTLRALPFGYILLEQEDESEQEENRHYEWNAPYIHPVVSTLRCMELHHVTGNQCAHIFSNPVSGESEQPLRRITQRRWSLLVHKQLSGNKEESEAESMQRQHGINESVVAG